MTTLDIIAFTFGALGFVFAGVCYRELWKWAKQCQNARIAIAHNKRVQINAPLTEWLTWANMLTKDESSAGRVVYRNAKVSVAILRPRTASRARVAIGRVRSARHRRRTTATAA